MRLLVLMSEEDHFGRWDRSTDAERQAGLGCFRAFSEAVRARGSVLAGEALAARLLPAAYTIEVRPVIDAPVA